MGDVCTKCHEYISDCKCGGWYGKSRKCPKCHNYLADCMCKEFHGSVGENEVGEPAEPKVKGLENIKLPEDKQYLHDVLFGKPIKFNVQFPSGEEADISLTWDDLLNNLSTEGLLTLKEEVHRRLAE